jgi:glutaconate CoA-transferase subunit B
MEPDPETKELTVAALHPGVARVEVEKSCGWPVKFAAHLAETPPPSVEELSVLRELHARTARAHGGDA